MWGSSNLGGQKAVAGCDEDSLTMAVSAAIEGMSRDGRKMDGVFFCTTTAPYKEKQAAAIIASAIDLESECYTSDFCNSLRAGTLAMRAAIDSVNCGSAGKIAVIASDCRLGAAQSRFEQLLGDGAAAAIIGAKNVIAEIEGTYSVYNEFIDTWRTDEDAFERGTEERFVDSVGYRPMLKQVMSGIMEKYGLAAKDFSKVIFNAPDARAHAAAAKMMGFEVAQVQDNFFAAIGNTGTAASFIMLAAALDHALPGQRMLFINYGDGADAFILRVTDEIQKGRSKATVKEKIDSSIPISYGKYAMWRGLVRVEESRLPDRPLLSAQCLQREKKNVLALYGGKCKSCGTPQYPKNRVCVVCHAKDTCEDYKFSDKRAKLFTFSVDHLQPTLNPPGVNGVVDFEEGGRLVCELTDCDPMKLEAGMAVEMTFRKLYQTRGINNYFWKAKPVSTR
jgi:3-hydroxy-3-methylglutaryl CoA synthase